jgi:replicative DNA helicase
MSEIPSNDYAEKQVIASCLNNTDVYYKVISELSEKDFYTYSNRKIFECMVKDGSCDIVTISGRVPDLVSYLTELYAEYSAFNIDEAIVLLKDLRRRREYLDLIREVNVLSLDIENGSSGEIGNFIYEKLNSITSEINKSSSTKFKDLLPALMDQIELLKTGKAGDIKTGLSVLDTDVIINNGDLVILAGRPSMGKSALADGIARYNAVRCNKSVLFFSVEMSKQVYGLRSLCSEASVDYHQLIKNSSEDATKNNMNKIKAASWRLESERLVIDDTPRVSIADIINKSNIIKSKLGLDLILVDYIQIMGSGKDSGRSREQEVSALSAGLKGVARKFGVPVIALSQLSRECEKRDDKMPRLSDLRESGAIEQDADIVLMCYREEYYNPKPENAGMANIIVAKQRNGQTGVKKCYFEKSTMSFYDLESRKQEPEEQAWQAK